MMPLFQRRDTGSRLRELLDHEYDSLSSGRLEQLAAILTDKQRLYEDLRHNRPDAVMLSEIRSKAERNQHLIDAAARGIRSALERLEQLAGPKGELVTYDQRGKLSGTGAYGPTTRRRA